MKRTFKLTLNEIKHLKWTVLVMALALVLFTAALFSVVCVYLELTDNILNYFDTLDDPLSVYVNNARIADLGLRAPRGLFYGSAEGITGSSSSVYFNGNKFDLKQEYIVEENGVKVAHVTIYSAEAAYATDEYIASYGQKYGIENNSAATLRSVICLDGMVAETLGADVGDNVSVGGRIFKVASVYGDEYDPDDEQNFMRGNAFVAFVDEEAVFSRMYIETETSRQTYDLLLHLQRLELDADYTGIFRTYVKNLSIVNAFLIAIAVTIFIVNLLIMYAMISVILQNRRSYVCRLKTLGATDGAIFAVYYVILAVMLIIICIAAFFLAKLMVLNIMDICAQAFDASFTTKVSFGVAAIDFAVYAVLLAVLCFVAVKLINNKAIVQATRSD